MSPGFKRSLFDDDRRQSPRGGWLGRAYRLLAEDIWRIEPEPIGFAKRVARRAGRLAFLTVNGFFGDRCVVRASALTFVTVLSIVPLLAVSFATLKGLGFYDDFRTQVIDKSLDNVLPRESLSLPVARAPDGTPLDEGGNGELNGDLPAAGSAHAGDQTPSLRTSIDQVLDLVDDTNFTKLTWVALLVVLWAVLRLLGTIEAAFNDIWGVRRSRSFVRKLTDYLAIVVVTPMFLVVAVGLTSADQTEAFTRFLQHMPGVKWLVQLAVHLMPLLVGWVAFTFLYISLPNTHTRFRSSALGGFVAGTAWQVALIAHVHFQVGVANYSKIYSTIAALPIFLVWVQLSWVIVLFGAELAFAHQHERDYRRVVGWRQATPAMREAVALRVLARAVSAFTEGNGALSEDDLSGELGVPTPAVEEVLEALQTANVVEAAGAPEEGRWLLARDPGRVRVAEVLEVLEGRGGKRVLRASTGADRAADRLLGALVEERRGSAYNLSLRELSERGEALERGERVEGLTRPSPQST